MPYVEVERGPIKAITLRNAQGTRLALFEAEAVVGLSYPRITLNNEVIARQEVIDLANALLELAHGYRVR